MNAIEILKQHNIKKTPARLSMINAMKGCTSPMSENEMKTQMGELYDRITFYRNVQSLSEVGIIHKIVADNTTVKYALNSCEHGHNHTAEHAHFFCKTCRAVICMNQIKIQSYQLPEGFQFSDCDVIIKGLCKKCNVMPELQLEPQL